MSPEAFFSGPQLVYPFPGWGPLPLRVEVSLTPSDEVQALRQQLSEASLQLKELEQRVNRAEYLYRCETIINLRLTDYCRAHGFQVPRHLFGRPYDLAEGEGQ